MRYRNDGDYNREVILDWCRDWCEDIAKVSFDESMIFSKGFIEYLIWCCEELSTNKSGAGKFVRINKEIFHSENYNQNTAEHLFKTFCYILREIDRKRYSRKKWR